jgi:hypothetical protein
MNRDGQVSVRHAIESLRSEMKPLAARWDFCVRQQLDTDTPPSEIEKRRAAFYAGAKAVLTMLDTHRYGQGYDPAEIEAEIEEYAHAIYIDALNVPKPQGADAGGAK